MISLVLLSRIMNRGNTDMTVEMPGATMPLMYFLNGETAYNDMQPYVEEMDILRMNEHITPLDESRSLRFGVRLYGNSVDRISIQLRSLADKRLIEEGQIYDYAHSGDTIGGSLKLHDLLGEGNVYSLCFLLECGDGRLLRYYTRLLYLPDNRLSEKLAFALYFNESSFDKARAKQELPTYLESNAKGDNSSFTHVDIHSGIEQVSWGNLRPERVGDVQIRLRDIDSDSAQLRLHYLISLQEGEYTQYCFVEEYYRLRIGRERVYLLEFERSMEEVFDEDRSVIVGNKVQLGMSGGDIQKKENSDGHILAFVSCGRLFAYDADTNRLSYVFGFYDEDLDDARKTARNNDIRIFAVDESGNVSFAAWGYFPCGSHEGCVGTVVYYYDSALNTVEEQAYIPFEGSSEQLSHDVDRLCYVGERGMYMIKDDDVFELSIRDRSVNLLAQDIPLSAVISSDSQEMLAWGDGSGLFDSDTIFLRNLLRGNSGSILSEAGEKLLPISFFGNDLVYGIAREEDITSDLSGHTVFPMYAINIRSQSGQTLKEYSMPDIYITAVEQRGDMLSLTRMRREGDGFVPVTEDQILNNGTQSTERNELKSVVTERFETIWQLELRSDVNLQSLQIMRPRLVLFEGDRRIKLTEAGSMAKRWELIRGGRSQSLYTECYEAVISAYEQSGTVQNAIGRVIYRRSSLPVKNQIMAIDGAVSDPEDKADPLQLTAACIDTMLDYWGEDVHSFARLYKGQEPKELIRELMPAAEVLDLSGVALDAVLYYIANETPVMVQLADGSAMLLVGYNELNVVVMDPKASEQVYKIGKNDATALFAAGGNRFLACLPAED